MSEPAGAETNAERNWRDIALLTTGLLLMAVYCLVRYSGHWGEIDTHAAAAAIGTMTRTGKLQPGGANFIYPNGYTFQVIGSALSLVAGISIADIQVYGAMLLAVVVIVPAWLLYRELVGSGRGATLATALLLTQPEFLFVLLRGTHEKFTRALMLLCLFLLARSIFSPGPTRRMAALVLSFYLLLFSTLTLNNLLAISFIVALALALGLLWLVGRRRPAAPRIAQPIQRRLGYGLVTSLTLAFLYMFYAYPPASYNLTIMSSMVDQLATLLLNFDLGMQNPYSKWVGTLWVNMPIYYLLSLSNWLLLGASALIWGRQGWRWLVGGEQPESQRVALRWALYGAVAIQGALSVVVDMSGFLSANLQHRTFPFFVMVAAPLAAGPLLGWLEGAAGRGLLRRASVWSVVSVLALLAMFKASNEPLFSNKWLFYQQGELQALEWAAQALPARSLWTERDERIIAAMGIRTQVSPLAPQQGTLRLEREQLKPETHDLLISDLTRARSLRMDRTLPIGPDSLITYDNGEAQIYHERPSTPYQP